MLTSLQKAMERFKDESGFTLIELMLAIFIMTVGLVSTMKMMANFRDASVASRDQVTAINIGIRKMEDLMGKPFYYDFETTNDYVIDTDLSDGCHEDPDGNGLVDTCVEDSDSSGGGTSSVANVYFDKFTVGWFCISPIASSSYSEENNFIDITLTVSWTYHGTVKQVQFRTLKSG